MRLLSTVFVVLAAGAVAPVLALAQTGRQSPGASPGWGNAPVVTSPDEQQGATTSPPGQPGYREKREPAAPGKRGPLPPSTQQPYSGGPEPVGPGKRGPSPPSTQPPYSGGPEPAGPGKKVAPPPSVRPPYSTWPEPGPPPPSQPKGWMSPSPRQAPEISTGWPLKRPLYPVIVRRRRDHDRVRSLRFLPPLFFGAVVVGGMHDDRSRYDRHRLSWSDSERIYREEGWVEIVLDCDAWGDMLWLEILDGRARVDWAEIVFSDGEAQVVDFNDRSLGPGLYRLLDYRGERRVDHVRLVAMATTRDVLLILRMER